MADAKKINPSRKDGKSKGTDARAIAKENETNGTIDEVNGLKRISY